MSRETYSVCPVEAMLFKYSSSSVVISPTSLWLNAKSKTFTEFNSSIWRSTQSRRRNYTYIYVRKSCGDMLLISHDINTLRQLRLIKRSLPSHALNTLVTGLVHSRLDYCNIVFACLPACDVQRLQSILNTAVRLVAGSSRCDHVTLVLQDRHWLPVKQCIEYKQCRIVHRYLYGDAPSYLVDLIT